jgi:hypothetical protein
MVEANQEKETVVINGKTLVVPNFSPKDITIGMRRKTRNMNEARTNEEIFFLLLEEHLTEEELEVWDSLTDEEIAELGELGALDSQK